MLNAYLTFPAFRVWKSCVYFSLMTINIEGKGFYLHKVPLIRPGAPIPKKKTNKPTNKQVARLNAGKLRMKSF